MVKTLVVRMEQSGFVGMAVLFAVALSIASFYTTYDGLTNFTGSVVIALLISFGIQGTLYIASWIVANDLANEDRDNRKSGRRRGWFVFRHPMKVLMLLTCMFASVFFSFDSLFDSVFTPLRQDELNRNVGQDVVTTVLGDVEQRMVAKRTEDILALKTDTAWTDFERRMVGLIEYAKISGDRIREAANRKQAELLSQLSAKQTELAELRKTLAGVTAELGALAAPTASAGASDTDRSRLSALDGEVSALQEQLLEIKAKLGVEEKAGGVDEKGVRRKDGRGPVWRQLDLQRKEVDERLKVKEEERRDVAARVKSAGDSATERARKSGILSAQKQQLDGQIAALDGQVQNLEQRRQQVQGDIATAATAAASGAQVQQVTNLQTAMTSFIGTGSDATYKAMVGSCSELFELLQANPQTKADSAKYSCDTTGFASSVGALSALDKSLEAYRQKCTVQKVLAAVDADGARAATGTGDRQFVVAAMVREAQTCLGEVKLDPARLADPRARLQRIAEENSPNTSHFERSVIWLTRGNPLAWIALIIAISIDLLVFISAVLGARFLVDPLVRAGTDPAERLKDINAANVDTRIYGEEGPVINNKLFLRALGTSKSGQLVLNLQRVAPGHRANVENLVRALVGGAAVTADAWPVPGGGGYRYYISQSAFAHHTRKVSEYEYERRRVHGPRPVDLAQLSDLERHQQNLPPEDPFDDRAPSDRTGAGGDKPAPRSSPVGKPVLN
jgi:hypothetical protein